MERRVIIATILLVLAIEVGIITPLLAFTPAGTRVVGAIIPTPPATPSPVLTARGTPPAIESSYAYIMDADTGNMLVNIQGDKRVPMASTTKIMTAYIVLQEGDLNKMVTIQQDALDEAKNNNGSNAQLVVGDQLRLQDLLYALMLPSGDDAAISIAQAISGSTGEFVKKMNSYAQRLHLKNTHYVNPDGLTYKDPQGQPDPNHYSSAADLVKLSSLAMKSSLFSQIIQLQRYHLAATNEHHAYTWETTNELLSIYAGATGVKTGYTPEAGYCLVFSATQSGHHLIGAVLNAKDAEARFADARELLNWSFALPLLPPPPTPSA